MVKERRFTKGSTKVTIISTGHINHHHILVMMMMMMMMTTTMTTMMIVMMVMMMMMAMVMTRLRHQNRFTFSKVFSGTQHTHKIKQ